MKKYLTPANIKFGIIVILSICALILLNNIFHPGTDVDKLIEAKDETIKAIQNSRRTDSLLLTEKERSIKLHEQRDSALKALDNELIRKYKNNQQQHTTNEKVYQQIPYDINRLNKSDLRRRIADY